MLRRWHEPRDPRLLPRSVTTSAATLLLQAGVLDPRHPDESDVAREIRRDPQLTERQREMLIEIYEAFCLVNRTREG